MDSLTLISPLTSMVFEDAQAFSVGERHKKHQACHLDSPVCLYLPPRAGHWQEGLSTKVLLRALVGEKRILAPSFPVLY